MTIYPVTAPEFAPYGRVITGYETECEAVVAALSASTPLPEGTDYLAEDPALQNLPESAALGASLFGGMPFQMGWCNGHNTKLNCLEYHRDSEFNLGTRDFILLLAKQDEIVDGTLDTSKVKAFRVPAGILVEVYATTLHYAPLPHRPRQRIQGAGGSSQGNQHRQAEYAHQGRGRCIPLGLQQVAAGSSRFRRGRPGRCGGPDRREH